MVEFHRVTQEGLEDALDRGMVAGYPVIDIKATLFDGSYHDVDSSEMAFHIAGSMCFKEAMAKAGPAILEPIMKVEVDISCRNLYTGSYFAWAVIIFS